MNQTATALDSGVQGTSKRTAVFGLPLLAVQWPEVDSLNEGLASLLLDAERNSPSVKHTNLGGWQSEDTLHTWQAPEVARLMCMIYSALDELHVSLIGAQKARMAGGKWAINAWGNVNRANHFNAIHYHGGFWSGVYYVSAARDSEDSAAGSIVFRSPNASAKIVGLMDAPTALKSCFNNEISVHPSPGLMLLFPSWLDHWVRPHRSALPRISIAFNLAFERER